MVIVGDIPFKESVTKAGTPRFFPERSQRIKYMKHYLTLCWFFLTLTATGCAIALVGAGATGGYKAGSDERSVGGLLDDTVITSKINAELLRDPVTKARKIDVDTLEGNVIMTGVVYTVEESKRAEEIAAGVPGVKKVKNDLQVGSRTFGRAIDDTVLGSKIKAKLIAEPGIRSLNIDVDVNKGVVILTGIVESGEHRKRAIEIARNTCGTVSVVNNIQVKNP